MWSHECSLIEEETAREIVKEKRNLVYIKTGGVPFYAKTVGLHLLNDQTTEMPTYQLLKDHLAQLLKNRFMPESEKAALHALANGEKIFDDTLPDGMASLVSKGIVKKNENTYSISIGYLQDYIKAIQKDKSLEQLRDKEQEELDSLVDEIAILRDDVNKKYKGGEPFETSTEDPIELRTLKRMCLDNTSMSAFSSSLYKLYYEGSNKGNYLPDAFKRNEFYNMVCALRHLYNHRDCELSCRMTVESLLFLINKGRQPHEKSDFKCIQKNMLDRFRAELLDMLNVDDSISEGECNQSHNAFGIFHKGQYGKKNKVTQRGGWNYNNIPSTIIVDSIRSGEYLEEDSCVEYIICDSPRDSQIHFWVAKDVHQKET